MRKLLFAQRRSARSDPRGARDRCGPADEVGGALCGAAVHLDQLLCRRTSRRRHCQQGHDRSGAARAGFIYLRPAATTGVTTASTSPTGAVIGGQIGCDYQFASSMVVGIEGSASGSTMKGSTYRRPPARQSRHRAHAGEHRFSCERDRADRLRLRQCPALRPKAASPWPETNTMSAGTFTGRSF